MKLATLLPLLGLALAASPALSQDQDWSKRADETVQAAFARPINPPTLDQYIKEAISGVKMINESFNIALSSGNFVPTPNQQKMYKKGSYIMTAALADAAVALDNNDITKQQAQNVGKRLKSLERDVVPIAIRVGNLRINAQLGKEMAKALVFLESSYDQFYQALKSKLDANARETVAGYVKNIICAIDAAIENLDKSQKLTDENFCPKNEKSGSTQDWSSLPKACPEMSKLQTNDVRKALYLHYGQGGEDIPSCDKAQGDCHPALDAQTGQCSVKDCGINWPGVDLLAYFPKAFA